MGYEESGENKEKQNETQNKEEDIEKYHLYMTFRWMLFKFEVALISTYKYIIEF